MRRQNPEHRLPSAVWARPLHGRVAVKLAVVAVLLMSSSTAGATSCPNGLPSWVQARVTAPELQSSVAFDANSAIAQSGSAQAALALTLEQIRQYEDYLGQLRSSGSSPLIQHAITLTEQALVVNKAAADVLRCWASQPAAPGVIANQWSTTAIAGLQGVLKKLELRRAGSDVSQPSAGGPDPRCPAGIPCAVEDPEFNAWRSQLQHEGDDAVAAIRERDRKILERQIREVKALLDVATSGSLIDDLDSLVSEIAPGEQQGNALAGARAGELPPKGKLAPSTPCTVEFERGKIVGAPADSRFDDIYTFTIRVTPALACAQVRFETEERCRSRDGNIGDCRDFDSNRYSKAQVIRVYAGRFSEERGDNLGGNYLDSIWVAAPECFSCDAPEARAPYIPKLGIGSWLIADRLTDEPKKPKAKNYSEAELKQLCANRSAIQDRLFATWHATSVKALLFGDLASDLENLRKQLLETYDKDFDQAHFATGLRVTAHAASAILKSVVALGAEAKDFAARAKTIQECLAPLSKDLKTLPETVAAVLEDQEFARNLVSGKLEEYPIEAVKCGAKTLLPALESLLPMVDALTESGQLKRGMEEYRQGVIDQIARLDPQIKQAKGIESWQWQQMQQLQLAMDALRQTCHDLGPAGNPHI
jgi:hypothetical protein